MIEMDDYTSIYKLKSKNVSIREISRILKLSRNTVRKYLRQEGLPEYKIKPLENEDRQKLLKSNRSKWDKHHDEIIDMHFNKKYIGSRIYNELKSKEPEGSESGFYNYLKRLKNVDVAEKARGRFETAPGKQEQFDWSHYTLKIGGELRKVYVFLTILCFSRYKHFKGSFDMTQCSLFESKEAAYQYFDGVPEESLMDNARQMVDNANRNNFEWNDKFLQFMDYYGVAPKACKVRHAWTKGKVENPFYYLEQHFIKGNEFASLDEFNAELLEFTEKWHGRLHRGMNAAPIENYNLEKEYLKPLPATPFVGNHEVFRKATNDSLISFEGNKYSISSYYAFKNVWIRKSLGDKLKIFSQKGVLIATHSIPKNKGNTIIKKEHYKALNKTTPEYNKYSKEKFLEDFPGQELYLENLASAKRLSWKNHINKILRLKEKYNKQVIEEALISSRGKNIYSYDYIHAFITNHYDIENSDYAQPELFNSNIISVNLNQYEEVANGTV